MAKIIGNTTTTPIAIPDLNSSEELKELIVGQKAENGGEIFNDYENNIAVGLAHAEGKGTVAMGDGSHSEGQLTRVYGLGNILSQNNGKIKCSITKDGINVYNVFPYYYRNAGDNNNANCAQFSFTNQRTNFVVGDTIQVEVEGISFVFTEKITMVRTTSEDYEGNFYHTVEFTCPNSEASHVEGIGTESKGIASHAEGYQTKAFGNYTHAEGDNTEANSETAHAEGFMTKASGRSAHAEGSSTQASGNASHAEGESTTASGYYSHAGGYATIASGNAQTAIGKYNIIDDEALFIVGNGEHTERHNAFVVKGEGSATIDVQGTDNKSIVQKQYVDSEINKLNEVIQYILTVIQSGDIKGEAVSVIENTLTSYLENKTVAEVEGNE